MQRMRLAKFSAEKKKKLKTGGFDPPKKKDPGSRNAWMMRQMTDDDTQSARAQVLAIYIGILNVGSDYFAERAGPPFADSLLLLRNKKPKANKRCNKQRAFECFFTMRVEQTRDKRRHSGGRQESASRKYDYDGYSNYESRGQTSAPSEYDRSAIPGGRPSEYDRSSIPEGRQTAFSEYTDGGRTPYTEYSENESGKQTPFSEYPTEYTYGTYDDRNPGTLGIGGNQYCTQLNGVFGVDESSSYEDSRYSSYSRSYSESDYEQLCDANVNTNCMNTLFNRTTDPNVPGTIRCDKSGPSEDGQAKMTLPLPLQFMDQFVSSKNTLPHQMYKSLFQSPTNASGSSSEEEEDRQDYNDDFRFHPRKNPRTSRGPQTAFDNHKEQRLASPPSQIVISDEASAVSSAGSLGFPGERETSNVTRRQMGDYMKINTNFKKNSFHGASKQPVQSPKSPHGLDRMMGTQVASPKNRFAKDDVASPRNRYSKEEVGSPKNRFAKDEVTSPKNRYAKEEVASPKDRFAKDEVASPRNRYSKEEVASPKDRFAKDEVTSPNSKGFFGQTDEEKRSPRHSQVNSQRNNKLGAGKNSQWLKGEREHLDLVKEESRSFDERVAPIEAVKTNAHASAWKNSASSIPYAVSFGAAPTAYSDLTSEFGDFGNRGKNQAPSHPSASTSKQHDPHTENNDTAGDELMQSPRLSPPKTTEHVDEGDELMGPQNATPPKSATILDRSQPDEGELMKWSSKPKKAETLKTIEAALMGPRKINSSLSEIRNREGKDSMITGDELMESQQAKSPSVSPSDVPEGDELMLLPSTPKKLKEVDIVGDELMGSSEGKPQVPSDSTHPYGDELMGRLSPKSKETPGKAPKDTGRWHALKDEPVESLLSLYPDTFSEYCKNLTEGDKHKLPSTKLHSTPNPISDLESQISNLESQISKLEQESEISKLQQQDTMSKFHKPLKSHKYTDIPLVTAPTAMTMETPFTVDTPLVSSPTFTAMEAFDPESKSKRFVATSVALPIHSNGKGAVVSFHIIFVQGTKKCLTDLLIIIIAWVRHFSNGRYARRKNGGMAVGLFLPSLDDSDVIKEHAVQGRPLAFYRLPSLSSDEPGMFVESFVPNVETTTDSKGRLSVYDVCLPSGKRSFWPKFFQKKVEIPTTIWETEQTWSDKYDQYEEFGFWNQ
jgi:hypothetical protein